MTILTKRTLTRRAAALGAAFGLASTPALAAGPVPPGFIWIGQASGGAAGGGGAAGASGTGATGANASGTGTTGTGTAGTGAAGSANGTAGAGTAGTGSQSTTGAGTDASGNAIGGTGTNGTASGTNGSANGTTGNGTSGNGVGTNGTGSSGNNPSQNGMGTNGTNNNGTNGDTGTGGAQGSLPAPGASAAPQTFDLTQTVRAALLSSADVQTATRNVEIDRKRSDEAAAAARPNVNASGTAIRYDQATQIALGAGPPLTVLPSHQEILTLNISDRLDLTGQVRAAADQARLQSLADQFILGQVRNGRILRAQTIYFNTLRAQHQVDVATSALNNALQQQTDAANLNAAGVGQKIDLLRADTQVAQARQNLNTALNNQGVALFSFNDLVGRPLNAPSRLTDTPGANVGVDVGRAPNVGAPTPVAANPFADAPTQVAAIDLGRALQTAFTQRPEILTAQVNVRVAQTGIKLARAGLEPTFSLAAAGNYYPTPSFQFPRQRTADIQATLNIPLYDGGATRDRVQEERLRTQNAQTSLASTQSDVALDVRQSYLNLATSAQQIAAANAALQAAVAARQLAELRFRGQVGLYLEVTDAQSALVQAENNQVDAVYNYLVSRAQFQNAVGAPQVP